MSIMIMQFTQFKTIQTHRPTIFIWLSAGEIITKNWSLVHSVNWLQAMKSMRKYAPGTVSRPEKILSARSWLHCDEPFQRSTTNC